MPKIKKVEFQAVPIDRSVTSLQSLYREDWGVSVVRKGTGEMGRTVSQLNAGGGRAAVLYIPLSLQAAELGSAGHASPPAWTLPTVEVIGAARTGEGGADRRRGTEVRGGTTAVDKSRRRRLKEAPPVVIQYFDFTMQPKI